MTEHDRTIGGRLLAGALAYRMFLWLLPFALVVVGGLGFVPRRDVDAGAEDLGLSGITVTAIQEASTQGGRARWVVLILGVFYLYIASSALARTMRTAAALAWQLSPRATRRRGPAAGPVAGGLLMAAFAAALLTNPLRRSGAAGFGVATLLLTISWVALWWVAEGLLPHREPMRMRQHLPGAILVGVGTQVMYLVTVARVPPLVARASESFGVLGAAAAVLLWFYLLARLLIGSAALDAALSTRRSVRATPTRAP